MKKALVIGAIAATSILLASCQQPKPAAVETPVTPPVSEPTAVEPVKELQVQGVAEIVGTQAAETDTIKVTGVAEVGGAPDTQLLITPQAEILPAKTDTIKVTGEAEIVQ